jgi:hypothetical protein
VPAGGPVHGNGREVGQNKEELEGNRFRLLPWSGSARGGGSAALGGGLLWWSVVVVLGGLGGREARLGGAWRGGEPRRAFYRSGKVGSRRYFELRGAPMAANGGSGKIPAWTPAGGILGRFGAV